MLEGKQRENFERAFSTESGGCRRTCECGREFYNPDKLWSWDEGELEALYANSKATSLDYTVGTLIIQGVEYVQDCGCWLSQAEKVINFITVHDREIVQWLKLEKERKTREAADSPVVDEDEPQQF